MLALSRARRGRAEPHGILVMALVGLRFAYRPVLKLIGGVLLALGLIDGAGAAVRIDTIDIDGTAFRIALSSGQVLYGTALQGATFE
jgi:hypothetical protein